MLVDYVANRPSQLAAAGLGYLRLLGHDVREIYTEAHSQDPDPETGYVPDWGTTVEDPDSFFAGSIIGMLRYTRARRADVTIVNGYSTAKLFGAIFLSSNRIALLRSDSILGGMGSRNALKKALFSYLLRRGWVFAAVSTQAADCLASLSVPRKRIVRMPYLLPAVLPDVAPARPVDLVVAAKFNYREGGDLLIEVILEFRQVYGYRHRIVVLGDGDLMDRGRLEGLGCDVRGFVRYDDYLGTLASAKVLLHLPRVEPWGASVVEALALGTGVVASHTTGAAKEVAFSGGRCSEFVRLTASAQSAPGDLASMIRAWSPEEASSCAKSIRSMFAANTWERALLSASDLSASRGWRNGRS